MNIATFWVSKNNQSLSSHTIVKTLHQCFTQNRMMLPFNETQENIYLAWKKLEEELENPKAKKPWWTLLAHAARLAAEPKTHGLHMHNSIWSRVTFKEMEHTTIPLRIKHSTNSRCSLAPEFADPQCCWSGEHSWQTSCFSSLCHDLMCNLQKSTKNPFRTLMEWRKSLGRRRLLKQRFIFMDLLASSNNNIFHFHIIFWLLQKETAVAWHYKTVAAFEDEG